MGGCIMNLLPDCVKTGYTGDILLLLGLVYGSSLLYNAFVQFSRFLRNYVLSSTAHLRQYGQWAVVTGGTDGIGKAYAEEFARAGLNVFIISRTQSKLDQVAAELAENFPQREIRTLAVDFSGNASTYASLKSVLEEMDVGILLNNVGMGYEHPMQFHELSEEAASRMININILSMTMMTKIVLPGMVQRKRGAVLNMGSASGIAPTPYLGLYSGTKAFSDFFTRSMEAEYGGSGLVFQSVMPFFVATKLAKIRKPRLDAPSPSAYAKSAVKTIGVSGRTHGYWFHSFQAFIFFTVLPEWMRKYFVVSMSKKMRLTALKKLQKAAEKKAE